MKPKKFLDIGHPVFEEVNSNTETIFEMDLFWKLYQVLCEAKISGSLVYGLFNAGKLLERNPSNAKLCVMRKEDPDVIPGESILMCLLESLCWGNSTPVLRVKDFSRISLLFGHVSPDYTDINEENCFVIKGSGGKEDCEELKLLMTIGLARYREGRDFEVDAD